MASASRLLLVARTSPRFFCLLTFSIICISIIHISIKIGLDLFLLRRLRRPFPFLLSRRRFIALTLLSVGRCAFLSVGGCW